MPACPLTALEREKIRSGIDLGFTSPVIAAQLGRHRATISSEIRRNGGRSNYSAVKAHQRALAKLARPKPLKLLSDPVLRAHVGRRLVAKDSPMTISIELAARTRSMGSISHETIYQGIYAGLFAGSMRTPHLCRKRRKHRGRVASGSHSLGDFCSIHIRPKRALERVEVGHLEGDLIVGSFNRSALITVVDRMSRHLWIGRTRSKTAVDVGDGLTRLLRRIPLLLRRSLTWDQGSEIAQWATISQQCGIQIFIADRCAPWQRPSNENINAHVRRYVGKGTDLNQFSPQQLTAIQTRINTTPRRSLNWASAHDIYTQTVAMTE